LYKQYATKAHWRHTHKALHILGLVLDDSNNQLHTLGAFTLLSIKG